MGILEPVAAYLPVLDVMDVSLVCVLVALFAYAVSSVRAALKDKADEEDSMVDTSHMHHIPFSVAQVLATLLGTLNAGERPPRDQIQMWKEFGLKVDLVFTARYHLLKKSLIEDFEPFDPNLGAPTDLPAPKVNLLEDRFFSNMREMLAKANFRMLGREEAETATSHDFLNTVPIEPEWLKLDPVFQRYMEAHPDLAAQVPNFASRLWIFHRGVGLAKFNGIVPMQAVDLLLLSLLGKCCGKANKHKEPPAEAAAAIAEDDKGKQEGPKLVRGSADLPKDSVLVESKGVKRIGMRNQVLGRGLVGIMQPVAVQEPTFKEVVLIYRVDSGRDSFHSSANPYSIYVKIFRDIPHADLEVLYPCKHTSLRAIDTIKFVGAGMFGVISLLMQRQAGEVVGYSALGGFVGLLVTVLFNYQYQKSVYEQSTLHDMYNKAKDADKGAINYLMEEVCTQEVKETLLAYWFLVQSPEPLSQEQLDETVESFLREMQTVHGHKECAIDFEVDDALQKLVAMNLVVHYEDSNTYKAIALSEGVDELNRQWASLITAVDE